MPRSTVSQGPPLSHAWPVPCVQLLGIVILMVACIILVQNSNVHLWLQDFSQLMKCIPDTGRIQFEVTDYIATILSSVMLKSF